ncbi:hypothetical protein E4U41_007745, partial [Claviceps citrina]
TGAVMLHVCESLPAAAGTVIKSADLTPSRAPSAVALVTGWMGVVAVAVATVYL